MYEQMLIKTQQNLNILQEREAKYGGHPPLELIHQIRDHKTAIGLTEQAKNGELSEADWRAALKPLLLERKDNNDGEPAGVEPKQPPLPFEPEMTLIPAGVFLMGSEPEQAISDCETPQHEVYLPAYKIGKYPITNAEYAAFVHHTGRFVAPETGWEGQAPPDDRLTRPVVGVTWYDALAYCQWLSEQSGRPYTLPAEAHWEKAARGIDGRLYPWGNEWEADRCNYNQDQTTPVDAYPPQSVYQCYDLVGNAREWTGSLWGERLVAPDPKYHYPWTDNGREDLTASAYIHRVHRGGAFGDKQIYLRCSARRALNPTRRGLSRKWHGFRVVLKE